MLEFIIGMIIGAILVAGGVIWGVRDFLRGKSLF